jgi:hypothetical protein
MASTPIAAIRDARWRLTIAYAVSASTAARTPAREPVARIPPPSAAAVASPSTRPPRPRPATWERRGDQGGEREREEVRLAERAGRARRLLAELVDLEREQAGGADEHRVDRASAEQQAGDAERADQALDVPQRREPEREHEQEGQILKRVDREAAARDADQPRRGER